MTTPATQIDRREAIRRVSALLGGTALISAPQLLAALENPSSKSAGAFTAADIAFLDEVAETILPETKTPGAKAAKVGAFMAVMVTDCYRAPQQVMFREGMQEIEAATRKKTSRSFMQASAEQRLAVLTEFDAEQKGAANPGRRSSKRATAPQEHFFRMMKELTFLGYFTSEIGCTQALHYEETPGRYKAVVPYVAGQPAWADHA
ncbi:gluconate 2-dehydrogenase subunit 3 family protein [Burkholderiaceae bacterium UC74_6]